MNHLILTLVCLFIVTNIFVEAVNLKSMSPLTSPLSAYLAGVPFAWVQDLGFGCLAVGLALVAYGFTGWIAVLFALGAAALPLVVWTKYQVVEGKPTFERYHVIAAGVAFVATTAGLLLATRYTRGVPFYAAAAVPGIAFLFMRFAPTKTTPEEKSVTIALMVSLVALLT